MSHVSPLARLALACALFFLAAFVIWPALALADPGQSTSAGSIVATTSIWYEVWQVVQPLVVLAISILAPVFAALLTWLSAKLISILKITDEAKKQELEAGLNAALHQSATNALKFALSKARITAPVAGVVTREMIADAVAYVQDKNPDAISKLGVGTDGLKDIIMSKVPDVLGVTAKVTP